MQKWIVTAVAAAVVAVTTGCASNADRRQAQYAEAGCRGKTQRPGAGDYRRAGGRDGERIFRPHGGRCAPAV